MPLLKPRAFVNRKDEAAVGEYKAEALQWVLIPIFGMPLVLPTH